MYKTTWAGDHPSQSYIATFGISAVLLLLLSRLSPQLSGRSLRAETDYVDEESTRTKITLVPSEVQPASRLRIRLLMCILVVTLCGRVEFTRLLLQNTQCARYNLSVVYSTHPVSRAFN